MRMRTLAEQGVVSFADEWLPATSELNAAFDYMTQYLDAQESKNNGTSRRWVENLNLDLVFGLLPQSPLSATVRQLLSPSLVDWIADYLMCKQSEVVLDSVAAVQFRGGAGRQKCHVDHGFGARVSVVLVVSLTSAPLTTRFRLGSHLLHASKVSNEVSHYISTGTNARMVMFDAAIHHYGVGDVSSGSPDRWYGRDRLFLTFSRPLSAVKRSKYAAETLTPESPRLLLSILHKFKDQRR